MGSELWLQAATGVIELRRLDRLCLAGFAGRTGPAKGVDHPLELNALLLSIDRGSDPFLIVSGDLLYFGAALRDAVRGSLSDYGLEPSRLLLLASHTHCAPATDVSKSQLGAVDSRFLASLATSVADLVLEARGREPVRTYMRHGRLQAAHALQRRRLKWYFQRRPPFVWREAYMGPNPFYRLRDEIDVVLFESVNGDSLACLWSYACHPSAYPRKQFVHADYVGVVRKGLRRCLGDDLPVAFAQGAAGDIRPDTRPSRSSLLEEMRTLNEERRFAQFSESAWSDWAEGLAQRVVAMVDRRKSWSRPEPCLAYAESTVALSDLIDGTLHASTDLRLVAVQLSKRLRLLVMSAEPVNRYRKLFSVGNAGAHLVVGCEGDVFGYLPTERMLPEGGYEVRRFCSYFGLTGSFRPGFESRVIAAGRHALRNAVASGLTQ